MSSYNFTIPATTKEITQTCRTLPILIIFLVYILPLRLSVSLSLCLSHPKSLSADSCPCLFSSIGSRQNVAQVYYTYQLRLLLLDLSTTPPSVSHLQSHGHHATKILDYIYMIIALRLYHQFSKKKAAAPPGAHDSSCKVQSSLDW